MADATGKVRVIPQDVFWATLIYWLVEMPYGFYHWFFHFNNILIPGAREHWFQTIIGTSFAFGLAGLILGVCIDLFTDPDSFNPWLAAALGFIITVAFYEHWLVAIFADLLKATFGL